MDADELSVRSLREWEVPRAAELHEEMLPEEFLSRCGQLFLRHYYLAWMRSESGLCLAVQDSSGELIGVLLGSLDPSKHYRSMLKSGGIAIGFGLIAQALKKPAFAKELIRTRGKRYLGGLWRMVLAWMKSALNTVASRVSISSQSSQADKVSSGEQPNFSPTDQAEPHQIGEVTHLFVDERVRGIGAGTILIEEMIERARTAGLDEIVLVTPPDSQARKFYERLGWQFERLVTSRSNESFSRYRFNLKR